MKSLLLRWHLDMWMTVFMICLCVGYFYLIHFKSDKRNRYFFAGYALILLSVASPLYFLGENYLMSAHMVSHVILLLIAAPLLVMGIPEIKEDARLTSISGILVKYPWISWTTGVCMMWFWHIPSIFNHLTDGTYAFILNDIQMVSLIAAGILFCWPVIGPLRSGRLNALTAVLYLSTACIFCSVLGLLITFAPSGVYTRYIHIEDHFGFLNWIRNQNGISALVDQQVAGLIMWVPGCLIYLTASMYLLVKWFREKNEHSIIINQTNKQDGKSI